MRGGPLCQAATRSVPKRDATCAAHMEKSSSPRAQLLSITCRWLDGPQTLRFGCLRAGTCFCEHNTAQGSKASQALCAHRRSMRLRAAAAPGAMRPALPQRRAGSAAAPLTGYPAAGPVTEGGLASRGGALSTRRDRGSARGLRTQWHFRLGTACGNGRHVHGLACFAGQQMKLNW